MTKTLTCSRGWAKEAAVAESQAVALLRTLEWPGWWSVETSWSQRHGELRRLVMVTIHRDTRPFILSLCVGVSQRLFNVYQLTNITRKRSSWHWLTSHPSPSVVSLSSSSSRVSLSISPPLSLNSPPCHNKQPGDIIPVTGQERSLPPHYRNPGRHYQHVLF